MYAYSGNGTGLNELIMEKTAPLSSSMVTAMIDVLIMNMDGFIVEILLNHRLSENDIDVACFFTLSDIDCFPCFVQASVNVCFAI